MAEIGIIASVICVAGCGFRLSLLLNAVGCEAASSGIEIHSISKGVTLFSLILKQVGHALQAPDSVHSPEALETAQEIAGESQMVFDEIQEMLDRVTSKKPDGSRAPSVQQRFKWCFRKGRVQYLLGQLESLKMSLLLMLQILQLAKLMASTPNTQRVIKSDTAPTRDAIAQERVETQNLIIVRYWQINRLDRLFAAAEMEERGDRDENAAQTNGVVGERGQLAIEAPPDSYRPSTALIRLPVVSLGELDATLSQIKESPREMLRVSDHVIDPLLSRWTRWPDIKDGDDRPRPSYAPSVQHLDESDEERLGQGVDGPNEIDDSPRGHLIEGTTTDWRKPQSVAARQEAAERRKRYAHFQPSVSIDSSDDDGRLGDRPRNPGRPSKHHVIDSGSETSDAESEPAPRTQSGRPSTDQMTHGAPRHVPRPSSHSSQSYSSSYDARPAINLNHSNLSNGRAPSGRCSFSGPWPPPPPSPQQQPGIPRPPLHPQPYGSPLPPLNTSNVPNPYAAPSLYSAHSPYSPPGNTTLHPAPPPYPGQGGPHHHHPPAPRYGHGHGYRLPPGPMPPSPHDLKGAGGRSPSRISRRSSRSQRSIEDLKKSEKARKQKNIKKSATKSILGASAIAAFLEGLEGLEL